MTSPRSRPLAASAFRDASTYAATRRPVGEAWSLVPDAYCELAFHELERERIFDRCWVPVGVVGELPEVGSWITRSVGASSVIVARTGSGEIVAHRNVCRHRGSRLCAEAAGRQPSQRFQCPYHGWTYQLDGRCVGRPMFHIGHGADRPPPAGEFDLFPVRVAVWATLVFVCLDGAVPPLTETLGDLVDRLAGYRIDEQHVVWSGEYTIAADWKLVAENFVEYYHLPWVHPDLVKVSPVEAHHDWQGDGDYIGFCTSPIAANSDAGGWEGLPAVPGVSGDDAVSARFAWVFPTVAVNALPTHTVFIVPEPTGPGLCRERVYLLVHPDSLAGAGERAGVEIEALAAFWDTINREDIGIVERVQAGLADPAYPGGRFSPRFEATVHRFQNRVIDAVLETSTTLGA